MLKKVLVLLLSLSLGFVLQAQDPNLHIYLCFGQSNMEGNATIEAQDKTGVDSRFQVMGAVNCNSGGKSYTLGKWQTATPPIFRCNTGLGPADYFGRTMVANLPTNIKVGVVPVAIGGCDIALFHKQNYASYVATAPSWMQGPIADYGGNPYARLVEVAKLAQKDGVIKGMLLHQGETNSGQQDWPNKVKAIYDNLIKDLGLDPTKVPLLVGELVTTAQGGSCGGHNSIIAKVPSVIPNSHVISAASLAQKGDGLHFTPAAYRTLGQRYADKMLTLLPKTVGPTVSISAPLNNAVFSAPSSVTISATATTTTGTISKVEFYNGATKLGEDLTSPYSYIWANVAKGSYSITVVATDNSGNKTISSAVAIKVNNPQAPYNDTWNLIPGTIQAENYDVGGNGSAYSDASAGNTGGTTSRTDEDVDLEVCTDAGAGYNLSYATAGEWLEYSVDVQKLGLYDVSFRVAASGDARTISLSMDDKALATNVAIPNTAGWQTWQTVTVKNVTLQAGKQILRLTIGATDYVNINYVTFTLAKEIKQESYRGTVHSIPGRIEAEEYDLGGEGLAYHEGNTSGNQGLATLRNDEVDIETTGDVDGMYNIAYTLAGEWLEYSVNVASNGKYDMEFRVAKDGTGGLFHVEIDGVDVTGSVTVPNTGGWQVWEIVEVKNISMTSGLHILKVAFDSDYTNFNYMNFKTVITGVESNESSGIQLYPNPFTTEGLHIEGVGSFEYKITDVNGHLLEIGTTADSKVIGQVLGTGVYFLNIDNQTFKVLKY
jgi:Carbohydrate esterase, sialic acid-specific acetylesterase/Carbohydrate binding module (family 6)/Bacterial Ig domain